MRTVFLPSLVLALVSVIASVIASGGCNDTAATVKVVSDRAPGQLDAICVELDAAGASRFGRTYDLKTLPLPQTLSALAGGRSSMQALVYGLLRGVEVARARKLVPFRPGTLEQVELALDACAPRPRAPSWQAAGMTSDGAVERALLVPAPDGDWSLAAASGRVARYAVGAGGPMALGGGAPAVPLGAVRQIVAADLNRDCLQDAVVIADGSAPALSLRAPTGEWLPQPGALPPVLSAGAAGAAAGDLDGDGSSDLVVVGGGEAHLLTNDGAGSFREVAGAFDVAPTDATAVALGDLNGDGNLDVVVAQGSTAPGVTRVYLNDAKGSGHFALTAAALPPRAERASALALADVDGNGTLDMVVAHLGGPVRLYLNRGDAFLEDRSFGGLPDQVSADVPTLLLADLNGDCLPDLIVPRAGAAPLLWLNAGGGRFNDSNAPAVGGAAAGAVADDVDGDGLPDLLFFGVGAGGGLALFVQR